MRRGQGAGSMEHGAKSKKIRRLEGEGGADRRAENRNAEMRKLG